MTEQNTIEVDVETLRELIKALVYAKATYFLTTAIGPKNISISLLRYLTAVYLYILKPIANIALWFKNIANNRN